MKPTDGEIVNCQALSWHVPKLPLKSSAILIVIPGRKDMTCWNGARIVLVDGIGFYRKGIKMDILYIHTYIYCFLENHFDLLLLHR